MTDCDPGLETLDASKWLKIDATSDAKILSLGIIWHKDVGRIGGIAPLKFDHANTMELSRLTPLFQNLEGGANSPLLDQHLSRSPVVIQRLKNREFKFTLPPKQQLVRINGKLVKDSATVSLDDLDGSIVIVIANSVVLALFESSILSRNNMLRENFGLLGVSKEISFIREMTTRVSKLNAPILIRGETGTGKELVAKAIHQQSPRSNKPMTSVNMAAMIPNLAVAELFGTKKGAFTGASEDRPGLFEQANDGILFLDEIGDTPRDVQPMLLRILEDGELRRLGDEKVRKVNVQIIAATDRSLINPGETSAFNQPLLQRLSGIVLEIPPLKNRRIDIGILIKYFLNIENNKGNNFDCSNISVSTIEALSIYDWPGNIRELRNVLQNIALGQPFLKCTGKNENPKNKSKKETEVLSIHKYRNQNEVSEEEVIAALDEVGWVIKPAAEKLGVSRTALYDLMEKSNKISVAEDIPADIIKDTIKNIPGGIESWAKHLKVGREALNKRIRKIADE